ncbi:MAG: DNA polymerase [Nocardioidaceae bacterium]
MQKFETTVEGEPCQVLALPDESPQTLKAWEAFTHSDSIFGLDAEATIPEDGDIYSDRITTRLLQVGTKTEAWVFDPEHPGWAERLGHLLRDPTKRFVAHNAPYDSTRVLQTLKIDLGDRIIDTLPMAALLWPGRTRQKGLKSLASEFIDTGLADAEVWLHARFADNYHADKPRKSLVVPKTFEHGVSQCRKPRCEKTSWLGSRCGWCKEHYRNRTPTHEAKEQGWGSIDLHDPEYLLYAGLDTLYVRRLLDILAYRLQRAQMATLSRREQRVRRMMTATSVSGHRVDGEWTEPILAETEAEFTEAENQIADVTGFKARSPKLGDWLRERGLKVASLDKDHLPKLIAKYEGQTGFEEPVYVLRQLETISGLSNLLSNLRIIYQRAQEGDGFSHSHVNTLQAHTGRMSMTKPAMQTLSKTGEKGTRLRGCFIARDGFTLVGADYDSQEIRVAAALSGDPMLTKVVREGLNQHVITAESIWADFAGKEAEPERYHIAKTLDFAQQYGAGPRKIAATLGINEADALGLWRQWRETYATLVAWTDKQALKSAVRNPFGRLIPRDPFRKYANGNYLIQSTGRDILGRALCRLDDDGWRPSLWLTAHDEIELEVPVDMADDAVEALGRCMVDEVNGVPITATAETIGTRWRGL